MIVFKFSYLLIYYRFMELHHEQAPFGEHRMQMSSVANFIGLTREGLNTTQVTFVSKVL